MSEPLVSVVVATHDRPARLARLLSSLAAQSLAAERFEVVVVDDGSGAPTAEVLAKERARERLALRVLHHPAPLGAGAARNAGWRAARAALIAFTDDDCTADARWLERALEAHREHPGAIVQGRTEPDPAELTGAGLLSRTVHVQRLGPQFETCNIFYPRGLLDSLDGFDEGFGLTPGGEDTDLAWRALERGHEAVFAERALVMHAVERLGMRGQLRESARWTRTIRVFSEHPQTRAMLTRGVFWNVWHYLLLRSVVALLAPAWLRRMILAGHLLELRRRARRAGAGTLAVPLLLLFDIVELWAVARGALRYRTLVL